MLPTYREGTINFANRAAYWLRDPRRGDAVAIRMAGPGVIYVKRIVGLPRERIIGRLLF
jgi:signal peptidase I